MTTEEYKNLNLANKKKFWLENPIEGDTLIEIPQLEKFKMFSRNDDTVVKELYWTKFKGWETTSLVIWNYFVNKNTGAILDIGSYSGIYSLIAASNSSNKIFAFDIQQDCVDRVRKNVEINGLNNISSFNYGFGAENGSMKFYYKKEENIMTSVASLIKAKAHNTEADVEVKMGDDLIPELVGQLPITLLKIDVEGAEINVIKGMKAMIAKYKPNMLIEINDFSEVFKLKRELPSVYVCYQINESKPQIKKIRRFSFNRLGRNYLFTTQLPSDLLHLLT